MSGSVSFNVIPSTIRVPGVYFEVDASNANTSQFQERTLIVGQMLSSGAAVAGTAVIDTGIGDAKTNFGTGSMLANMLAMYRQNDPYGEVWLLPLADNGAGVAGTGTITITGPATQAGTLNVYIAGVNVQVGVSVGDSANTIASNIHAAINLVKDLPCSATVATDVVTIIANHKGAAAGDVDVRVNYRGKIAGEVTPAGVTVTIVAVSGGVTDPDATSVIPTALSNLGDKTFDYIVWPYALAAQMAALEAFLSDVSGRWSYVQELFGGAFSAYRGTVGALTTYAAGNNNQHVSVLGYYDSPTPAYLVAADYGATSAASLTADPALPLQNINMNFAAPPLASQFDFSERNSLLYTGISTFKVNDAGQVILERSVTTYTENAAGSLDDSYLDTETLFTLMYLIRSLRSDLQTKFSRRKLVATGTRIPYGVNFVTSDTVRNEVIANYRQNAALGLCQSPDLFAQQVVAENAGNGRVSIMAPFMLANQLRAISVLAQFTKP